MVCVCVCLCHYFSHFSFVFFFLSRVNRSPRERTPRRRDRRMGRKGTIVDYFFVFVCLFVMAKSEFEMSVVIDRLELGRETDGPGTSYRFSRCDRSLTSGLARPSCLPGTLGCEHRSERWGIFQRSSRAKLNHR